MKMENGKWKIENASSKTYPIFNSQFSILNFPARLGRELRRAFPAVARSHWTPLSVRFNPRTRFVIAI
jgi:hypothetical protein